MIPPTVHDTYLKGKPIEKAEWTVSSSEVAEAVISGLKADEYETAIGPSKRWLSGSKDELDEIFRKINH